MTVVPLPDVPTVRCQLVYNEGNPGEGGNRFFLSYSGSAPSGANCATLASDIATAWNTNLAELVSPDWTLNEVDVLDIATNSGLSGQWTGAHPGTNAGALLSANTAVNIEFDIARRYRGGKPRMFLPPPSDNDLNNVSTYSSSFVTLVNTQIAAFFAEVVASSVGSMGSLAHINLSYYQGFVNVTNSSGRTRAAPKYRTTAKSDAITGYSCKQLVGSQRRRRSATTP